LQAAVLQLITLGKIKGIVVHVIPDSQHTVDIRFRREAIDIEGLF